MRRPTIFFLFLATLFAIVIASLIGAKHDGPSQPLAYNHQIHTEEAGAECLDCHQYAEVHSRASIPNIEVCRDCHDEATGESEAELTLVNYLNENRRLPWVQVHTVPDHVYFSHRRHVKIGELGCETCHGDVGKLTAPFSKPHVEITMEWCMDCHEANGVSNDCYACHR
jgi:hypothetical protein